MRSGRPSLTARGAAAHRAIHQRLEAGAIFGDPFALRILDADTLATLDERAADPAERPMRLFIAARSRFSENALAAAAARGVRQVVVLGAGLDTFALRNCSADVRVFEVDYPATQTWKRKRLEEAGIAEPASLIFAPVDFEQESLAEGLAKSGFRADDPAFFQWLGVVPYLTREAISDTLALIGTIGGSEVVFDYAEPIENYPPARRAYVASLAERVAERGEPWLSLLDPADVAGLLRERGFDDIEDLGIAAIASRFYGALAEGIPTGAGAHLVRARRWG